MLCIKRFLHNKDGATILSNLGYLSLLQVANYAFPFITMPYLARVLGVEKFGILAIGTAVISYFQSITDYGFNYTSVKKIARVRDDINAVSEIVSTTFYAKVCLMLFSAVILSICTIFIPLLREYSGVIFATFLLIPGHALFNDWFFQAIEKMKYITILSVLSKFLFTIAVFIFINHESDYIYQPILIATGYAISAILGIWLMCSKFKIHFLKPSIHTIFKELRSGFNMFITLFLPTIYTNLNTLVLGGVNGDRATGIYSGATRFTSLAYNLFMLISRAVYPYFARKIDKHTLYARTSLLLSIVISLFFFIFARPLVLLLLGPEFQDTVIVLQIVAFTPVAMSITNSYGINFLVLKGKEAWMRNIIIAVTIIGLVAGTIGAIFFSFIGVAIASLLTQSIRATMIYLSARKIKKHN